MDPLGTYLKRGAYHRTTEREAHRVEWGLSLKEWVHDRLSHTNIKEWVHNISVLLSFLLVFVRLGRWVQALQVRGLYQGCEGWYPVA